MNASWSRFLLLFCALPCVAVLLGQAAHASQRMPFMGEALAAKSANEELPRALEAIRRGRSGIGEGFDILSKMDLRGRCPDQLLALVHSKAEDGREVIWRLGLLIARHKLSISGKRLAAEYDKAGKAGRRARQALCALAAYQTGRKPPESFFGETPALPKPRGLDGKTLALLARALAEDDPAVRVAAADSIRLAGAGDDRFLQPLLNGIDGDNTVVSDAASLAAAELGFERAAPRVLRRLERHLKDPEGDGRGSLAACGLPLAPFDYVHLWGACFSPRHEGGGWIPALGMLRYRPALPLLRRMGAPHKRTEEEVPYLTGGEGEAGWEGKLAKAIVDIENRPDRPAALVQLAEDRTLAGDVRADALRMFDRCERARGQLDPATGVPILTDLWRQCYEPGIIQRVIKLIDDQSPITELYGDPSRLGRLAIEVAAGRFCPDEHYYQTRLHSMGKPSIFSLDDPEGQPPPIDPATVYPKDLLPVRRQLREKLESLLPGRDGALALEALAVACPEWGTIEKYVGIARDPRQRPLTRVAAANLLTSQPFALEMESGGFGEGKNAPPETAGRLLPLLGIQGELRDSRHEDAIIGVFQDLLGYADSDLTDKQKAARKELLPKLRAMRGGPHADAALRVLLDVYGFTRAAKAWDAGSGDPSDRPRPPEQEAAAATEPPPEVTARRSFFRSGIALITLAQNGKTLVIGSGSRVILLNPRDLSEKAKTSIQEAPGSSHSAVPGPDGRHAHAGGAKRRHLRREPRYPVQASLPMG